MNELTRPNNPDWPLVDPNDDGIRPAGKPDECLYCRQKIGSEHGRECVIVTKRVKVRYSFEIEVDRVHCWTKDDIEFHRNESSSCANNAADEVNEYAEWLDNPKNETGGCLCNGFTCEFIEVVDDTPRRKVREADGTTHQAK